MAISRFHKSILVAYFQLTKVVWLYRPHKTSASLDPPEEAALEADQEGRLFWLSSPPLTACSLVIGQPVTASPS